MEMDPFEMVMITGLVWILYGDFGLTTGSISEHRPKVRGDYTIAGSNHNKPAYKKEQKARMFFFSADA